MAIHVADRYLDRAACIRTMTPNVPTLTNLADFVSNNDRGVTLNWTTNNGIANTVFNVFLGGKVSVRIVGKTTLEGNARIT